GSKAVDYLRQAGLKATARSALHEARPWFEEALDILNGLPHDQPTLEKAFDIRLELRPVLFQLDELRGVLERLREAERIADRLNDEERQSHVWASMAWSYRQHGDLDEALAAGTRALEIAERREDLEGRLYAASGLVELHWFRGELFGAIELAHKV